MVPVWFLWEAVPFDSIQNMSKDMLYLSSNKLTEYLKLYSTIQSRTTKEAHSPFLQIKIPEIAYCLFPGKVRTFSCARLLGA